MLLIKYLTKKKMFRMYNTTTLLIDLTSEFPFIILAGI